MAKRWFIRKHLQAGIKQAVLILASVVALYPVFWLVATAFKDNAQYRENIFFFSWPLKFTSLIQSVTQGKFGLWFTNSFILTFGSVLICTVIALFAAFAFAHMRFRGKDFLFNLLISIMVIPVVILIVPLFILYTRTKLMATHIGLIIIYSAVTLPFSVYLLTNFFKTSPVEMLEAGIIDGCSNLKILTRIILPISGPPIATLIVVNALWVWNELLLALVFLPKDNLRTLMVGITVFKNKFNLDIPVTMAGLLITTLPMVVLYIIFQKFFIRGLTAGSVKG